MKNKEGSLISRDKNWDNFFIHRFAPGLVATLGALTAFAFGGAAFLGIATGVTVAGLLTSIGATRRMRAAILEDMKLNPGLFLAPKEDPVSRTVARLAEKAGMTNAPRVVIDGWNPALPFASAMGNRDEGLIFVSPNLEKNMTPAELEAVMAHEIAHIRNNDSVSTRSLQNIGVMAKIPFYVSLILMPLMATGIAGSAFNAALPLLAAGTFIGAEGIKAAVSRAKERRADREAVMLTENPWALAGALERIRELDMKMLRYRPHTEPKPGSLSYRLRNLFSTHPDTAWRRQRLEEMGQEMIAAKPALAACRAQTILESRNFRRPVTPPAMTGRIIGFGSDGSVIVIEIGNKPPSLKLHAGDHIDRPSQFLAAAPPPFNHASGAAAATVNPGTSPSATPADLADIAIPSTPRPI